MKTDGNHWDNRGHAEMLKRYRQYLLLEKSLSPNTLEAYMDDASKLLGYLDDCGLDLTKVTLDDLHGFAAAMGDLGIAPRSQARIISGIKSLFRFLCLDGYREDDPSELLEAPKTGRHLPDVLSVEEIDSIIDMGCLNALFVIGRSIGIFGHVFDQKRLKQPLYRTPYDEIAYMTDL